MVAHKVLVRTFAVVMAESDNREWNSLLLLASWVYKNCPNECCVFSAVNKHTRK